MRNKGNLSDLAILEQLPPHVDLRLLADRFEHFSQPRKKVFDLVRKGYLEFVRRGHYLNLRSEKLRATPIESLANALYFPSYVSAEWALQHYGLLTDRVHTVTSVTPNKSTTFKTSLGDFEFRHLHKHRYSFGFVTLSAELGDPDQSFMIARPEKALLDYLKLRGHVMTWSSIGEMESYFTDDLRIHLSSLLEQTAEADFLELIPHYHRNSDEARILKWLLAIQEKNHG